MDGHQIHKTQTRPTHPAIECLLISDGDEAWFDCGARQFMRGPDALFSFVGQAGRQAV